MPEAKSKYGSKEENVLEVYITMNKLIKILLIWEDKDPQVGNLIPPEKHCRP